MRGRKNVADLPFRILHKVLDDVLAEFAGLLVADVDPVVGA